MFRHPMRATFRVSLGGTVAAHAFSCTIGANPIPADEITARLRNFLRFICQVSRRSGIKDNKIRQQIVAGKNHVLQFVLFLIFNTTF